MSLIEESLSSIVLDRNEPWEFDEVTLSTQALTVLAEINGIRNLGTISKNLGVPILNLQVAINELEGLRLISLNKKNDTNPVVKSSPSPTAPPKKRMLYRGVVYS